ncbi:NAD(P)/FAD-dependent oxidoreductase [Lentzea sp. E54]|uniref:NAD(P)/FAD-dependent oxidoreductase n=1 Tax=Lentzea xerophila TaxID=3435883 RepID=UPI003DA3DFFC
MNTHVIIGAGLAGAKAAEALRTKGFDGRIVLVGDEPHRPYERPPLSKDVLIGKAAADSAYIHDESWYTAHDVELRLGVPAERIDRGAHRVDLADGTRIGYDTLLLTTGARPRTLPVPGATAEGVHQLRRIEDSQRLREALVPGSRLVVVGAGWIGLEATAAARQAGVEVTVLEAAELPLLKALGPEMATVFADLHRRHGVDLRFGVSVREFTTAGGKVAGVRLADGAVVPADTVLVGVGAIPDTYLAETSGLAVDNGILVDASLRTADPDVFAAGDVANVRLPALGGRIRVEHWANALKQPAVAAAGMLGEHVEYDELPYFYTDQYDLGMEYVGHASGYDQVVVRGDVTRREFIAFWLKDEVVVAGMNVNIWDVTDAVKGLIRSSAQIDPARLADPSVPLESLVTAGV